MSSDRAKHWAWSQLDLSGSELLVLLAMADNVGEKLICYASLATLGEMARKSERTVQRILEKLVDANKLRRHDRPGRTTLFELAIPAEFGERTSKRRVTRTPDKMTGVHDGPALEATPANMSGDTPDKMTGVEPTTERRAPSTNWRGTHDKMSDDSSLNSSLLKTLQSARAGKSPAPAREGEEAPIDPELYLLNNTARNLGITPKLADESIDTFRRRIDAAHLARLNANLERRAIGE